MELSCGVWRLGLPANEFWKWAVRFLREPSGPVPASEPLPPSRPANEVMPEPSRGWGIWILLQRVCGEVGEGGVCVDFVPRGHLATSGDILS